MQLYLQLFFHLSIKVKKLKLISVSAVFGHIQATLKLVKIVTLYIQCDRLCGLVVRVPDYISKSLGSIPGVTRFSEK
jgi:hypothetical protein